MGQGNLSLKHKFLIILQVLVITVMIVGTWYYTLPKSDKERLSNINFNKGIELDVDGGLKNEM